MLVICNGAAKSGSTWLYNIVENMSEFSWPPKKYISASNSKHPTIKEKNLRDFVNTEDYSDINVISKNHYGKVFHREVLLVSKDIRIIDMSRDTRDVIVSSYYDSCRRDGCKGSFSDYYWKEGRLLVDSMKNYHDVWSVEHRQVLNISFEELKNNFAREVARIAQFLDITINDKDILELDKKTNIDALRTTYKDDKQYNTTNNPFFRKGAIGDWKNHFDDKMSEDYERINSSGIGRFDLVYLRNRLVEKITSLIK